MSQFQFVPKSILFEQLGEIVEQQETGFLTILTDTNRSVLLRFSNGRLTRLHCRSKEAGEVIHVLVECNLVKFTYASAPEDEEPELMPASTFLKLINPGGGSDPGSNVGRRSSDLSPYGYDPIKTQMLEIVTEYVGIVAEMIIDEAFEENRGVGQAIDHICNAIPDDNQARAFRKEALEHFSTIDF